AEFKCRWIERLEATRGEPPGARKARRICFVVGVGNRAWDLFYNAPDGLRGRYWQSPNVGCLATRYLIGALKPRLMALVAESPPKPEKKASGMDRAAIEASLNAPSAKVWVREREWVPDLQLEVRRWRENETPTNWSWRRIPIGDEIEVKGAFLGPQGEEYIPEGKRRRSCQIHCSGFT